MSTRLAFALLDKHNQVVNGYADTPSVSPDSSAKNLVYAHAIEVLSKLLTSSAKTVENSTEDLNHTFANLASGAKNQALAIQKIMEAGQQLEANGEQFTIQEFMEVFSSAVSSMMDKIVLISEMSMRMAYFLDQTNENLSALESFIGKINKINKETNLLALNATIEAARFGEEGKGFAVVAEEVKEVSKAVRLLTSDMNKHIGEMGKSLRGGYEITRKLATTDMTENILAREKIDQLLNSLIAQNHKLTGVMQSAMTDSAQISEAISRAVIGMQFQDRNSQQIHNAVTVFALISAHLKQHADTAHLDESAIAGVVDFINQHFTLSDVRRSFMEHLATHDLAPTPAVSPVENAADGDDIELF